jgi:protein ImuB
MGRVACVSIPHFIAELERQRHEVEARPLLVAEGKRVLASCAEAAAQSVEEGDALHQALARCPDALVVPADRAWYESVWEQVLDALDLHNSTVESVQWGLAYADADGMGRLYSSEGVWCQAVQEGIFQRVGMKARIGVTDSKFAAIVAARSCPPEPGYLVVEESDRRFLAPFPTLELPLSAETLRRLNLLGIRTVGQFARLPRTAVAEQFGPEALEAHRWARGEDKRPLTAQRQTMLEVQVDFDFPENRQEALLQTVLATGGEALERLGQSGLSVKRIHVEAELDSGQRLQRAAWMEGTSGPERLRAVLENLLGNLQGDGQGVTGVRLRLSGLQPALGKQLDLFAHAEGRFRLEAALRRLVRKHAPGCVVRAAVVAPESPLVGHRYGLQDVRS